MYFSIVVPLYNKANSIIRTLNSILSQSHQLFEIIVVNDGSTDDGERRVKNIDDPRITLINQDNQGVSAARNHGVRASRAEYVVFFDADDLMGKHYLKHIVELIESFPNIGAYGTRYQYSKNNCVTASRIHGLKGSPLKINNYFYTASKGDLPIVASGVCISRKVLDDVGVFPLGQVQGEDQDLWSRIGLKYSIAVHPSCDITYVLDAENRVSVSSIPKQELQYSKNLQKLVEEGDIPDAMTNDVKRYIAGHLLHLVKLNINSQQYQWATKLLKDSRTRWQPLRRIKWQLRLILERTLDILRRKNTRENAATLRKPIVSNLMNDKKMGGILSVVKSLSESRIAKKYHFDFQLVEPTSWIRGNLGADIVMVHYASSWRTIIPNLITRIANFRSKMILQEHHYTASFERSTPSRLRFRIMLKLNYFLFDKVIAVSNGQSNWINSASLLKPEKSVAIPQCRKLNEFLKIPHTRPSKLINIGAYGRLAPEKGFDKLIKAFNVISPSNLRLNIAGDGPERQNLVSLSKGNDAISLVGAIDDIPSFLEKCDLIVIPSTSEAFGLVCLEAKAAARPVIASNIDGLREQLVAGGTNSPCGSLIYENSVEEISKLLRLVPKMPLKRWGENGRGQVLNAWKDYQDRWDRTFESLLQSN